MMTATQSHRSASSKLFPSILALLLLTSCSLYQGKLNTANEPKLNPNPKERYDSFRTAEKIIMTTPKFDRLAITQAVFLEDVYRNNADGQWQHRHRETADSKDFALQSIHKQNV